MKISTQITYLTYNFERNENDMKPVVRDCDRELWCKLVKVMVSRKSKKETLANIQGAS